MQTQLCNQKMEDNERSKSFGVSFDAKKAKVSKEKSQVQLRQNKREALVQKRRNLDPGLPWVSLKQHYPKDYSPEDLPTILSAFSTPDDTSYLYIAHAIRRLLCRNDDCPIEEICKSEVMNHIIPWLNRTDHTQLQYETAWICTNISSSSQCSILYYINAIPSLTNLLFSSNDEVRYQVSWALGNISANSQEERDYILSINTIEGLGFSLKNSTKAKHTSLIIWTLTNICRKTPLAHISAVKDIFPLILPYLKSPKAKIVVDVLWAVCGYSKYKEMQEVFISEEGIQTIQQLFTITTSQNVLTLALRLVGGLCYTSGSTEVFINKGILAYVKIGLESKYKKCRKEAVWALGNMCAETENQLSPIINEGIFEKVIGFAQNEEMSIRKECVWVLCNSAVVAGFEQVVLLIKMGLMQALISLLNDGIEVNIILQGINKLFDKHLKTFQTLDEHNLLLLSLENCGGMEIIEKFVVHNNEKIVEKVLKLLRKIETQGASEDTQGNLMNIVATDMDI
ncbi:hypothetical protein SteCoe_28128 [Stentor coeruleus]|uniref:Importin subunit alpha n=1 Tax=Stentor coeruleus TaxID=5963 RepID=A0A1R2B8V7_9CILI|nr:hypothetical protein SteCoe_28128 [Stentor coeruleus]